LPGAIFLAFWAISDFLSGEWLAQLATDHGNTPESDFRFVKIGNINPQMIDKIRENWDLNVIVIGFDFQDKTGSEPVKGTWVSSVVGRDRRLNRFWILDRNISILEIFLRSECGAGAASAF
jgi:hypothetical protein